MFKQELAKLPTIPWKEKLNSRRNKIIVELPISRFYFRFTYLKFKLDYSLLFRLVIPTYSFLGEFPTIRFNYFQYLFANGSFYKVWKATVLAVT